MKSELLIADDNAVALGNITEYLTRRKHTIRGKAESLAALNELLNQANWRDQPLICIQDICFPKPEDGEKAAELIKERCSLAQIIAFSLDKKPDWADFFVPKQDGLLALAQKIDSISLKN